MKTIRSLAVLSVLTALFSSPAFAQTIPDSKANTKAVATVDVIARFYPSGWMGDGELGTKYLQLQDAWRENPHIGPTCVKITYTPGPSNWCGIYWQNRADNWGAKPGEDFSQSGFKRVKFWARGETGTEIVEFKAGGIAASGQPHRDSFEVSLGKISLKRNWTEYTLSLEGENLSSVIGGFCFAIPGTANPRGAIFYLDDIIYE